MTPEQINFLLETYGKDNLMCVELNNAKKLWLDEESRKNITFDTSNELIRYIQRTNGINTFYVAPFAIIEGMLFKNGDQPSFTMDGNKLATDENGKLVSKW